LYVKIGNLSANFKIRYESELAHEFKLLLQKEERNGFLALEREKLPQRDDEVTLAIDGRHHCFRVQYSLKPSLPELEHLISQNNPNSLLLVTPRLSPRVLQFCRQHNLSAIDLNGQAYLRAKGLWIDRIADPDRDFRFDLEPRDFFVGKSARIIRTLLTDRDRHWVQSELVERSKASSGLVSRIVKHLNHEGFVEKTSSREFRLRDPLSLLDAWVAADNPSRLRKVFRYSTFGIGPVDLTQKLSSLAAIEQCSIAFTQWIAGWLRHPYTEPEVISAYISRIPSENGLSQLGLRPVTEAGKVWLFVPEEEGVFIETQRKKDLCLVTDAQIYLDLIKTGLRGPEQATALRNWEGFCRP
jgi:hypothetical protein